MFFKRRAHRFEHTYIYVDEHKEKIEGIRQRAADKLDMEHHGYRASQIRGFLTGRTYRHRISTTTAITAIIICAALWYFLIH